MAPPVLMARLVLMNPLFLTAPLCFVSGPVHDSLLVVLETWTATDPVCRIYVAVETVICLGSFGMVNAIETCRLVVERNGPYPETASGCLESVTSCGGRSGNDVWTPSLFAACSLLPWPPEQPLSRRLLVLVFVSSKEDPVQLWM
jgi:hypothetical protein